MPACVCAGIPVSVSDSPCVCACARGRSLNHPKSKMGGSLGVNRELALLAPAMVTVGATMYDHLVVGVSPILISLDGFSLPGRAVKAESQG